MAHALSLQQLLACAASSLLLLLCPARLAGAAEYVVGDVDNGWTDSGVNYAAWAREKTFVAGDVLVFQYVSSQHNVYEVTESVYRTCDSGGAGVLVKYQTGNDRVVLDEARGYWFVCSISGHCLGGMKVAVNVSAGGAAGGGGASPPPSTSVPVPPISSAASPAAGAHRSWMVTCGLLALGVLVFSTVRAA